MRYILGIIAVLMAVQVFAGPTVTSRMIQKHGTQSAISSARLVYELAISTDGKELFYGYSTGKTKAVSDARFRRFSSAHILTVGPQGPTGPAGPTGATGATGPQGPAGTFSRPASFTNISTVASAALPRSAFAAYTSIDRPTLSNYPPMMNGYQLAGFETTAARGDHSHPSDSGKLSLTGGTMTGAIVGGMGSGATGPKFVVRPDTNSTKSFEIQKADGTRILTVDTASSNPQLIVGTATNPLVISPYTASNGGVNFNSNGFNFLEFNGSTSRTVTIGATHANLVGIGIFPPTEKLSIVDTGNVSIGNLAKVAATTNSLIGKHGVAGTAISGGSILTPVTDGFTITTAAGATSTLGTSLSTPSATIGDATNGIQISGTDLLLTGTATGWDDLRVEPNVRGSGVNSPTFAKYRDDGAGSNGVYAYAFTDAVAGSEKEVFFSYQMPHTWKEGSTVVPHVHWFPAVAGSAGNVVRWGLECSTANMGSAFPNTTTTYCETQALGTITTAYSHMLTSCGNMTMTGITMSAVGMCRLFRDSSHANDTLAQTAGLLYIDFHFEINRPAGSKTDTAN